MRNGEQPIVDNQFEDNKGLTKHEYFAGLAMPGMVMSDLIFEDIAHDDVKMAYALLAELRKQEYKSKQQEQ
jgi:hypothetical protein